MLYKKVKSSRSACVKQTSPERSKSKYCPWWGPEWPGRRSSSSFSLCWPLGSRSATLTTAESKIYCVDGWCPSLSSWPCWRWTVGHRVQCGWVSQLIAPLSGVLPVLLGAVPKTRLWFFLSGCCQWCSCKSSSAPQRAV